MNKYNDQSTRQVTPPQTKLEMKISSYVLIHLGLSVQTWLHMKPPGKEPCFHCFMEERECMASPNS